MHNKDKELQDLKDLGKPDIVPLSYLSGDLRDLRDRYSALKIKYERFVKLWNDPNLETKGELLWYYTELRSGIITMTRVLEGFKLALSDPQNLQYKKAIHNCRRLISRIKELIESAEVKNKLGCFATLTPSIIIPSYSYSYSYSTSTKISNEDEKRMKEDTLKDKENTLKEKQKNKNTKENKNTKKQTDSVIFYDIPVNDINEVNEVKDINECSQEILLKKSKKNKVGYDIGIDTSNHMNRRSDHRWDNSIKGKFLRGIDWIRRNPKMTAIIVVTTVGVIILLAILL